MDDCDFVPGRLCGLPLEFTNEGGPGAGALCLWGFTEIYTPILRSISITQARRTCTWWRASPRSRGAERGRKAELVGNGYNGVKTWEEEDDRKVGWVAVPTSLQRTKLNNNAWRTQTASFLLPSLL